MVAKVSYTGTFIVVAPDCLATAAEIPVEYELVTGKPTGIGRRNCCSRSTRSGTA